MKKKGSFLALILIMSGLLVLTSPLSALDSKSNRATLQGLKGIGVLVEYMAPEAEWGGLTKNQLQADVERRLGTAGIKVLTREESLETPGEPHLYINVNINVAKTESEIFPYSIDVMLIQRVSLLRDPKQTTFGVTWSTGGVGSVNKELVSQLRDSVGDLVEVFIKTYLAENQR